MKNIKQYLQRVEQLPIVLFTLQWLLIAGIIGLIVGTLSAFFLISLQWVTAYREGHAWIIALLPIAGLFIGLSYHYWGQQVVKGNNQVIDEILVPQNIISLRMTPLVLFGTLATHLFGGSAGREGTAVQMGASIADQLSRLPVFSLGDREILLIMGVSAGFASVFGTPLAATVFALEVVIVGQIRYKALLPSLLAALIADYVCEGLWGVGHVHYQVPTVPALDLLNLLWALLAGLCFGITSLLFSKITVLWSRLFNRFIAWAPLRPFVGGCFIALSVLILGTSRYLGLGLPTIDAAFQEAVPYYDFAAKLLYTSCTLGAGFKGGEVTPLFFIGATLGNTLATVVPLPMALLAGMGFVGVFSGATNTPLACTFMGIELFGVESASFIAIACIAGYLFSGHAGIYSSQKVGTPKHYLYNTEKGKTLFEIDQLREQKKKTRTK